MIEVLVWAASIMIIVTIIIVIYSRRQVSGAEQLLRRSKQKIKDLYKGKKETKP